MSKFYDKLQEHVSEQIGNTVYSVKGILVAFDKVTGTCTVEIANPTGSGPNGAAGKLRLANRIIPDTVKGVIRGSIDIGSVVVLSVPAGNYTYAAITEIFPPREDYTQLEATSPRALQRKGTSTALSGRLNR